MELAFFFYAAGIVDKLSSISGLVAIVLAFFIAFICFVFTVEDMFENINKGYLKTGIIITFLLGTLSILTPSKETMYTMAAAYGVQSAAENPNVQRVAGKSLQILESKLDEFIKEGDAK